MSAAVKTDSTKQAGITPENLELLCKTIYDDSGIVLDESKRYLLEARLAPLAKAEGLETIDSLCGLLHGLKGKSLRYKVVEAMTTNETLFFRDVKPFEGLKQVLFNEIVARRSTDRTLRVWCAAASSGQEPYSIAMLWKEMCIPDWKLEILGTDLSEEMLERCRAGRYLQLEVNRGLPAMYLVKHFERDGTNWVVNEEIRKMCRWQKFNLKDSMRGMGPFDLVFCRNVLIYFDQETKARILGNIRKTLAPGGHLFLGASETTIGLDESYQRRQAGPAIAYRVD